MSTAIPAAAQARTGAAVIKNSRRSTSPTNPAVTVPAAAHEASPPSSATHASSFRNVSACNRCRLRKNRCDQRLPACISCEKAGVPCVGCDPITKREVPRSYVYYLERRNNYLENLLIEHRIPFEPANRFDVPQTSNGSPSITSSPLATGGGDVKSPTTPASSFAESPASSRPISVRQRSGDERGESNASNETGLKSLVNEIGLVNVQGASDPRYLGSVSGISFARVVLQSVKLATASNHRTGSKRASSMVTSANGNGSDSPTPSLSGENAMRDSFFGLATSRKKVRSAKWPGRSLANRLIRLYFGHANPQLPVLHKGEFEKMVERVYTALARDDFKMDGYTNTEPIRSDGEHIGARELYMMNIVFAIGAGIFLENDSAGSPAGLSDDESLQGRRTRRKRGGESSELSSPLSKKVKLDPIGQSIIKEEASEASNGEHYEMDLDGGEEIEEERQDTPEAYHAAALHYLEIFLSESKGGIEELQAVLLLAGYALLRPVAPGLWYIVGVALRMAIDLGLHFEDNSVNETTATAGKRDDSANTKIGKKDWIREIRRRLWWSVYSLDRLVSTCVGRPVGIQDEVISAKFPSPLPDEDITPNGFKESEDCGKPTYKLITLHYLRLRLLQSEILQVLQQHHSSQHSSLEYPHYHPYHLQSPYLRKFHSLREWHEDVDRRLQEWIASAPQSKAQTGVDFSLDFLQLNYWQTVLMLYRPCIRVPAFAKEQIGTNGGMVDAKGKGIEIGSLRANGGRGSLDGSVLWGGGQEEEDRIHWRVAKAGSEVLQLYRQLHRSHQVNYTFLATHHLFMSGISFLYAVWHSPYVRSRIPINQIDLTILGAISVLEDLAHKCPPAQACKEAFRRMNSETIKMCNSNKSANPGKTATRVKFNHPGRNTAGISQMTDIQIPRDVGEYDRRRGEARTFGNIDQQIVIGGPQQALSMSFESQQNQQEQQRLLQHQYQTTPEQIAPQQQLPAYSTSPNWQPQRLPDNRMSRSRPDLFDMELLGSSIQVNTSHVRSQVEPRKREAPLQQPHVSQSLSYPDSSSPIIQDTDPSYFPHIASPNSPESFGLQSRSSPMTPSAKLDLTPTPGDGSIDLEFHPFGEMPSAVSPELIHTSPQILGSVLDINTGLLHNHAMGLNDIEGFNLSLLAELGDGTGYLSGYFG